MNTSEKLRADLLEGLRDLHAQVDRRAGEVLAALNRPVRCGPGCSSCCQDELTVFEIEALRILAENAAMLETSAPGSPGQCAMLDEAGDCRIYQARPYVCRTQGLPLRWLEETDDGWREYRDICPLNEQGLNVTKLSPAACYTLGPVEEALRTLQKALAGGALARVKLRDLFRTPVRAALSGAEQ